MDLNFSVQKKCSLSITHGQFISSKIKPVLSKPAKIGNILIHKEGHAHSPRTLATAADSG
jgi:hypothetical protein